MQKKKDYERAEAEVTALAKVEDEEEENDKPIPDSVDYIPCTIDKKQQVCEYLSLFPTSSTHINTGSPNPMDQQQNIPVSVISTSSPAVPSNHNIVSSNLMDQQQNILLSVFSTISPVLPSHSSVDSGCTKNSWSKHIDAQTSSHTLFSVECTINDADILHATLFSSRPA